MIIFSLFALLAAFARGGSAHHLAATTFRDPWLVFVGLIVQIAVQTAGRSFLEAPTALLLLLASMGLIALFLLLNLRRPGMSLAAVGLMLNMLVIGVNGAMPVHGT